MPESVSRSHIDVSSPTLGRPIGKIPGQHRWLPNSRSEPPAVVASRNHLCDRIVRSVSRAVQSCIAGRTMRALLVHNRSSSRVPSGENLAVDDEVRWLREAGVDVAVHTVSNDDALAPGTWARLRDGATGVWSLPARRRF